MPPNTPPIADRAIVQPPPRPTLIHGESGPNVKEVQTILKANGYFPDTVASGEFGPKTQEAVIHFQQTHLGPDRMPLLPDGQVGPKTWWALYNPSGEGQRQGVADGVPLEQLGNALIPRGIAGDRAKVLTMCCQQYGLGIHEVPDGSNTGDGVTKFHEWFGMEPAAWCAMSFCWVVNQALGKLPVVKKALVAALWEKCGVAGMSHKLRTGYAPVPGDAFVMLHSSGTGHIGIVASVAKDGKSLTIFEGNSGNRYALRRRLVGVGDHAGYINYFGDAASPPEFALGLTGTPEPSEVSTR